MEKVNVNQDICIGCGACMSIAPDVFEMNEEGLAVSKKGHNILDQMEKEIKEDVIDALEGCPTGAIFKEEVEEDSEMEKEIKEDGIDALEGCPTGTIFKEEVEVDSADKKSE